MATVQEIVRRYVTEFEARVGDTSGYTALETQLRDASSEFAKLGDQSTKTSQRLERGGKAYTDLQRRVERIRDAVNGVGPVMRKAVTAQNALAAAQKEGIISAREASRLQQEYNRRILEGTRAYREASRGLDQFEREFARVADTQKRAHTAQRQLRAAVKAGVITQEQATRKLREYNAALLKTRLSIANIQRVVGLLAGGFLAIRGVSEILRISRAVIEVNDSFIALDRTLTVVTGSAEAAAQEFGFVTRIAQLTGTSITSVADDYSKFAAASRDAAFTAEESRQIFSKFAGALSVLGSTGEQSQRVFRALTQIISKGRVQAEELRGQLGDVLPSAFQTAADSLGVTTRELDDMLRKGEVLASDLLPKMANALADLYGTPREFTVAQEFERARNEMALLIKQISETSGLTDGLRSVLQITREWLRELRGAPRELEAIAADIQRISDEGYRQIRGGRRQSLVARQAQDLAALRDEFQRYEESQPGERGLRARLSAVDDLIRTQSRGIAELRKQIEQLPEAPERRGGRRAGARGSEREIAVQRLNELEQQLNMTLEQREKLQQALVDIMDQETEAAEKARASQEKAEASKARAYQNIITGLEDEIAFLRRGERGRLEQRLERMGVEGDQLERAIRLLETKLDLEQRIVDVKNEEKEIDLYMKQLMDDEFAMLKREEQAAKEREKRTESVKKQQEQIKGYFEEIQDLSTGWQGQAADATINYFTGTKDAFSDLINSMLRDMARLALMRAVFGPLFGALFGTGGTSQQSAMLNDQWSWMDTVGSTIGFQKGLSYVPRDNFPAILHKGEAVLDAGTMDALRDYGIPVNEGRAQISVYNQVTNNMAGEGGGDGGITIIDNRTSLAPPVDIQEQMVNGRKTRLITLESEMKEIFARGGMDSTMQGRYGNNPRAY